MLPFLIVALVASLPLAAGHASIWHPSMYGFNVTGEDFPYDNRPVSPLVNMTFDQWWFHGHLSHPPNPGDIFDLPAGKNVTAEIACNKGATSFFATSDGGDIRDPNNPNNPCPGSPIDEFHTTGIDDVKGCALAIAYNNDANKVQPEDFTVFSINQTCVWNRLTDFSVPERMPPCPEGGCTCAYFWIHSPDSGGEQNYMNGFKCNVTSSSSNVALAKPQVPRRCGADPDFQKLNAVPGNCTFGAKQPFYWFQAEKNTFFEDTFAPPFYTDLYNFLDGPQNDIFEDSFDGDIPTPSPDQTKLPILRSFDPNSSNSDPSSSNSSLPVPSSSPSASVPGPSSTPGSSPSNPVILKKCGVRKSASSSPSKRNTQSMPARRSFFGLPKRSRKLNLAKRGSLWNPFAF